MSDLNSVSAVLPADRERAVYRVTLLGFVVNLALTAGKFAAGFAGRSGAMVADAAHSASDFLTDLVVMVFVRISAKPKDECHDYGHGKFETLATIMIGVALMATGAGIFADSLGRVRQALAGAPLERPGMVALAAAAVSVVAKELLYWRTVRVARRVGSPAAAANAWHHRSDAFSSAGALLGIAGARFLGEPWRVLDPLAAIVVSLLVVKVAYDLVKPGVGELLDRSLPREVEEEILSLVTADPLLTAPHNLRTRRIGAAIAVEVHVRVPGHVSVSRSHEATEGVERRIRERFGPGAFVTVHVEPLKEKS